METLSRNGAHYRTKLMFAHAAIRFAKCLRANERFTGVSVCVSERSPGKCYVSFLPASDPSGQRILDRQQGTREARAAVHGHEYEFVPEEQGRYCYCLNVLSGEVYETDEHHCTCPDWEFRCRAAGIQCKHIVMLRANHSPVRGWDQAPASVQAYEDSARAACAIWE